MTRLVVEVEAVAAVTELVRHGQHVGERRALGEGHGPLERREEQLSTVEPSTMEWNEKTSDTTHTLGSVHRRMIYWTAVEEYCRHWGGFQGNIQHLDLN